MKIKGMVFAVVAVPILSMGSVFAVGSVTGDHSIRYDRDGTWLCHMPYDRMSTTCLVVFPMVPVSKLNDVAPSARGYIRCNQGHWEIGNITISASPKDDKPFIDLTGDCVS